MTGFENSEQLVINSRWRPPRFAFKKNKKHLGGWDGPASLTKGILNTEKENFGVAAYDFEFSGLRAKLDSGNLGGKLSSTEDVHMKVFIRQGPSRSPSNGELKLKSDCNGLGSGSLTLSDFIMSAGVSQHGMTVEMQGFEHEERKSRSSMDSATMVEQLSHIPLNLRGRAEKWEIPRTEVKLQKKIGEGQGGIVFKCRWRALDCAAKLLNQDSKTSLAYHDMVNEISIIRSFLPASPYRNRNA
jgi:hypothetical protein